MKTNSQQRKKNKDDGCNKSYLEKRNKSFGEEVKQQHKPKDVDTHFADKEYCEVCEKEIIDDKVWEYSFVNRDNCDYGTGLICFECNKKHKLIKYGELKK